MPNWLPQSKRVLGGDKWHWLHTKYRCLRSSWVHCWWAYIVLHQFKFARQRAWTSRGVATQHCLLQPITVTRRALAYRHSCGVRASTNGKKWSDCLTGVLHVQVVLQTPTRSLATTLRISLLLPTFKERYTSTDHKSAFWVTPQHALAHTSATTQQFLQKHFSFFAVAEVSGCLHIRSQMRTDSYPTRIATNCGWTTMSRITKWFSAFLTCVLMRFYTSRKSLRINDQGKILVHGKRTSSKTEGKTVKTDVQSPEKKIGRCF